MRNTFIIVLLIALTGSLVANRNAAAPQDMVRYVDILRCMDASAAFRAEKAQLTVRSDNAAKGIKQMRDALQQKSSELAILDTSSERFRTLRRELQYDEAAIDFRSNLLQSQLTDKDFEIAQRVLVQINQACAAVGERNGYSALFAKEANLNVQFPEVATKVDVLLKRTLNWSNPAYDVTGQVIEMLNASAAQTQDVAELPLQQ